VGTPTSDFVNAVARWRPALPPVPLLHELLEMERVGPRSGDPNGPRNLDMDLLLFDDDASAQDGLVVPHPRVHERAFVLVPLFEIAPEDQHSRARHGVRIDRWHRYARRGTIGHA